MIDYDSLEIAFFYANGCAATGGAALIHRPTGSIHLSEDGNDFDEPLPEPIESGHFLTVPNQYDLDLGRDLVFRFVRQTLPEHEDEFRGMFHRRGAYRRFRDALERHGKLDAWFAFESAAREQALREWCADNGLEVEDPVAQ